MCFSTIESGGLLLWRAPYIRISLAWKAAGMEFISALFSRSPTLATLVQTQISN